MIHCTIVTQNLFCSGSSRCIAAFLIGTRNMSRKRTWSGLKTTTPGSTSSAAVQTTISHLDPFDPQNSTNKNGQIGWGGSTAKLKKGLERKEAPVIDIASQGALEATAEEIRDVLNEHLSSSKFSYVFRGVEDSSELIQITDVLCNQDYSHATAFWRTSAVEKIIRLVDSKMGPEKAEILARRVHNQISNTLRAKEGSFRSYLMRKMDFKRVPRVSFRPADGSVGLRSVLVPRHDDEDDNDTKDTEKNII